jgi:hypothetical protein
MVKSQNRDFIVGSLIGFYGIENRGDIQDAYYPLSNGSISGNGGLSYGLNVKHDLSKHIYGAIELRYCRKGSIYTFLSTNGTQSFHAIRLDYIEIPLSIGFKIKMKKKTLFAETGLAYARLFSSRMKIGEIQSAIQESNYKHDDISWVANLKYPINKSQKLLIGLRFLHSLFSIHQSYKLYNMDYGVEFYYLFNQNIK